jgi:hypothetical protein
MTKTLVKKKIQIVTGSYDVPESTSPSMAENTRSMRQKINDSVEAFTAIQSSSQGDSTVRKDTTEISKELVMSLEDIDKSEKDLELENKSDLIDSSSRAMNVLVSLTIIIYFLL